MTHPKEFSGGEDASWGIRVIGGEGRMITVDQYSYLFKSQHYFTAEELDFSALSFLGDNDTDETTTDSQPAEQAIKSNNYPRH